MDCIGIINSERLKLDGRPVSRSFHLSIVEQTLLYLSAGLREPFTPENIEEMQAACHEALEALAELRASSPSFP